MQTKNFGFNLEFDIGNMSKRKGILPLTRDIYHGKCPSAVINISNESSTGSCIFQNHRSQSEATALAG